MSQTLLIDLGNTALKWTTADQPDIPNTLVHRDGLFSKKELFSQWLQLQPTQVVGCTVASRQLAFSFTKFFNDHKIPWHWVRASAFYKNPNFSLTNHYTTPTQLGADRWFAALGAISLVQDAPLLVVHAGTATTVDSIFVDEHKNYHFMGGRIAPGPTLMRNALLKAVPTLQHQTHPRESFPQSTASAISTGIIDAQIGMIMHAYYEMIQAKQSPIVLLAGGAAQYIAPTLKKHLPTLQIRHNLVLHGLALHTHHE